MDCSPTRVLCPWDFPGKNTESGCHFHLQGTFPTQGLNPHPLHWQADSLLQSHQESPEMHTCVYIYKTESLCHTPEINNIINQLYFKKNEILIHKTNFKWPTGNLTPSTVSSNLSTSIYMSLLHKTPQVNPCPLPTVCSWVYLQSQASVWCQTLHMHSLHCGVCLIAMWVLWT